MTDTQRRSIVVHNRDIPVLAEVWCAMQEVRYLEERRLWQRERMTNITQHLTGMPGGGPARSYADTLAMLSELDARQEEKCREYARVLQRAQDILDGIKSPELRAFVLLKYLLNATNAEVQTRLNLSRREFEQARRAVEKAPSMDKALWPERYLCQEG